jgi:membrane protein required for colicin V production
MNPVDLAVILIVVLSALFGLTRGFVHELLSTVAWVAAIALTWAGGPWAGRMVQGWVAPSLPAAGADAAGPVIVFLVGLAFFLAVGHGIAARLAGGTPGAFSRLLGIVFGVARGALLVGYAYLQVSAVVPPDAPVLREARTLPLIEQAAGMVRRLNLPGLGAAALPNQPTPGFPGTGPNLGPAPGPNPGRAPAPAPTPAPVPGK